MPPAIAQFPGAAFTANATFARLPNWTKAMSKARLKSGPSNIFLIGDSTTAGYGAANNAGTGARALSYPPAFVSDLNTLGVPASDGGFFSDQNVSVNGITGPQYDPRVAFGSGWTTSPSSAVCGSGIANSTTTNPLTFTPTQSFDTVDIYYFTTPGAGTSTVSIDQGASIGTINYNASNSIQKATFTTSLGSHTISVTRAAGACYVFGMMTYNSAANSLHVFQLGSCGAKAVDFTSVNFTSFNMPQLSTLNAPALTLVNLGINDWLNNTSLANYQTYMQAIITTAKQTGDCVLVSPVPTAVSNVSAAIQLSYVATLQQLAMTNNVPLLDFHGRWNSFETANPIGFYFDLIHPLAVGYNDMAAFLSAALVNLLPV